MALSEVSGGMQIWRSPECEIHWAGWVAKTWHMQRCGWEFAIEQNTFQYEPLLVFRHREAGWTGMARCASPLMLYDAAFDRYGKGHGATPIFQAVAMKTDHQIVMHHSHGMLYEFSRVDMEPEVASVTSTSLKAMGVFRPWKQPQEIIVEPATVSSLLEQIKQLQAPELAHIREENRKRERRETSHREVACAQIITLEAA